MKWQYNDGGIPASEQDMPNASIVRALAILTGIEYKQIQKLLIHSKEDFTKTIGNLGFGKIFGEKCYLRELTRDYTQRKGTNTKILACLSDRYVAVIDGVLYDIQDSSFEGKRIFYFGYRLWETA